MRTVLFIGMRGCSTCDSLYEKVVAPLERKHPRNVSSHYSWDEAMARVNGRKEIRSVPLFVVENGGEEEFRFFGRLSAEQIEGIVRCEREAITLEEVLGGEIG